MSNKYTDSFISFAKARMATQGDQIRGWVNDPFVGMACKEIIEASQEVTR